MQKIRRECYPMAVFLRKLKEKEICDHAEIQRAAGIWKKGQINELLYAVLAKDYIPPVVLGEMAGAKLWLIDGLQRSAAFMLYRYGRYKITSALDQPVIPYKTKRMGQDGDVVWSDASFCLRQKTYEDLPVELKKRFHNYPIEMVIYEDCDRARISALMRRYNNHTPATTAQTALLYIHRFAKEIREILNERFFTEFGFFTEKEKTNGTVEKVVMESVMCMYHLEHWKTGIVDIAKYLNAHAGREEFDRLKDNLQSLDDAMPAMQITGIIRAQDAFLWLTFYHRQRALGVGADGFLGFLRTFCDERGKNKKAGSLFGDAPKDRDGIARTLRMLEDAGLDV